MMKKLVLALVLFLAACGSEQETLKPGSYKLVDSLNNVPTILNLGEDGRFSGKIVNNMMGNYELTGKSGIKFSQAATTMMMGPQDAMESEQNFLQILPKIKSYKMQGNAQDIGNDEFTDIAAVKRGCISVTPLTLERTDFAKLNKLNSLK